MPTSYYINQKVKDGFKIEHGLDPRSCYPRCDFCSSSNNGKLNKDVAHGTVQLGRWWAHADCAADPAHTSLISAQLPKLDYSDFADRKTVEEQILCMLERLYQWAMKKHHDLLSLAHTRGTLLIRETEPTEYL